MLSEKRINEAELNVKQYLREGLLKNKKMKQQNKCILKTVSSLC